MTSIQYVQNFPIDSFPEFQETSKDLLIGLEAFRGEKIKSTSAPIVELYKNEVQRLIQFKPSIENQSESTAIKKKLIEDLNVLILANETKRQKENDEMRVANAALTLILLWAL
jgi:hypothetical protein